jgi:hypothetical protein
MVKITINICGGLGNQLFQIFSLLKVCKDQGLEYEILEREESPSVTPRRTYWKNFFNNLNLVKDYTVEYLNFNEANNNIHMEFPQFKFNTILNGYFQSWKYINNIDYFEFIKLSREDEIKVLEQFNYLRRGNKKLIFVHIRHGDYIKLSHCHYVLPLEYYKEALKMFNEEENRFIFFSDDINYCKDNFNYLEDKEFIEMEDYLELYLMSFMDGGVIANSSFSLWGAILLEHRKNKNGQKMEKIIQPSRWFSYGNVFPNDRIVEKKGWIRLDY